MKVGIMQPYFVPYIGYWQLMNAVDRYVIYDDVNFIKGGWINRNRILLNGQPKYINVPMLGASSFKHINEIGVNKDQRTINKTLRTIEEAYRKAPFYKEIFPLVEDIFYYKGINLAEYITYSFKIICNYLDIKTELLISSSLDKDCSLHAQDKVLAICKCCGATDYYNTIGGKDLYSFEDFRKQGITLSFLKTKPIMYKQFNYSFQENLSIIDVMMFNSYEKIKGFLNEYTLVVEEDM